MSKQIRSKIQLFLFLVLLCFFGLAQEKSNPFYSYNFGGLENYSPEKQIDLLQKTGYDGIALQMAKAEHVNNLDRFLQAADKYPEFKIYAAFVRYNFQDGEADKNRWKTVANKIEGKGIALWFIFGKPQENFGDEYVEQVLRKVVDYAAKKKVPVVLYPHSRCYFYSAEQALSLVKKINHPNLTLAVHTCHEQRAGNGHRLAEVVKNVQEYMSCVTIAGADKEVDRVSTMPKLFSKLPALRHRLICRAKV